MSPEPSARLPFQTTLAVRISAIGAPSVGSTCAIYESRGRNASGATSRIASGDRAVLEQLDEPVDEGRLREVDVAPSFVRLEPCDPVHLGVSLDLAGPARPLDLELVRVGQGRVEITLDRPAVDDLAGTQHDAPQRDRRPGRGRDVTDAMTRLLGELPLGDGKEIVLVVGLTLRNRPGARVATGEERATRVGEQHLEPGVTAAVEEDPAGLPNAHWLAGALCR